MKFFIICTIITVCLSANTSFVEACERIHRHLRSEGEVGQLTGIRVLSRDRNSYIPSEIEFRADCEGSITEKCNYVFHDDDGLASLVVFLDYLSRSQTWNNRNERIPSAFRTAILGFLDSAIDYYKYADGGRYSGNANLYILEDQRRTIAQRNSKIQDIHSLARDLPGVISKHSYDITINNRTRRDRVHILGGQTPIGLYYEHYSVFRNSQSQSKCPEPQITYPRSEIFYRVPPQRQNDRSDCGPQDPSDFYFTPPECLDGYTNDPDEWDNILDGIRVKPLPHNRNDGDR